MIDLAKLLGKIDIERIIKEVMDDLQLKSLHLYFVLDLGEAEFSDELSFVGMAYSPESAREIKRVYDARYLSAHTTEIHELKLEELLHLAIKMGMTEKVA